MQSTLRYLATAAAWLAALLIPLAGAGWAGGAAADYLAFPPRPSPEPHAGFSWIAVAVVAALELPLYAALLLALRRRGPGAPRAARRFPVWGWAALAWIAGWWALAWLRPEALGPVVRHTFTPLWLGLIVAVNALTWRRAGTCLLTREPGRLARLFPVSAAFWWFFEYLNRFVANWHYVGVEHYSAAGYVLFATLAFSTVLPAVMSVEECLAVHGVAAGARGAAWRPRRPRTLAAAVLAVGAASLAVLEPLRDVIFPLVWIAPLLLVASLDTLAGRRVPVLDGPAHGDWSRVARLALAALACGFFWEMWNVLSLPKWIYSIPYVDAFHLFEMPLLGFAGYLPFGLECAVLADRVGAEEKNG
jgi:hypothetical protein